MMQINPDVCASYPITPQTPIIETYAQYVADGLVDTEMVLTESEHSALSVCIGASAYGSRTFTATASQGMLYMNEVVYSASGLRLPIVMAVGNRAISSPINIHCDHSDSFTVKDAGWIQIYCENVQEVYDTSLMAFRIAEKVNLPLMFMQDGFYTTHSLQAINLLQKKDVQKFLGKAPKRENLKEKYTIGMFALQDSYMEARYNMFSALKDSEKVIEDVQKEFFKLTGRKYSLFESYKVKDAEIVFIILSSTAQLMKKAVDFYRKKGKKVGLLRLRVFRPFPFESLKKELKNKTLIVMDRNGNYGSEFSALANEFKNMGKDLYNIVYGLGGREFNDKDALDLVNNFLTKKQPKIQYYGLRKDL
jgi:pyruvate ferredoxin oxidoreductase alpha subunit